MKIILTIMIAAMISCNVTKEDLEVCERVCKGKQFVIYKDMGAFSCECKECK